MLQQEQQPDNEIALIDILRILWKRKVLIVSLTLLLTVAGGVVSMVLPEVYKVSAIIEPAKKADGTPVEMPEVIRENILGGAFDREIQKNLGIAANQYPKLQVKIPKNTILINISVESVKSELAVSILSELLVLVSKSIEERLQIEKQRLGNGIKLAIINHAALQGKIKLLSKQAGDTAEKIAGLETARKNALASKTSDAMSVLLYSNEIQSQQIYLNKLQLQLETLEKDIEAASIAVDNARLRLSQVRSTNVNKSPEVSNRPIKPNKVLIVALMFMVGVMGSILMAFLVEYLQHVEKQS